MQRRQNVAAVLSRKVKKKSVSENVETRPQNVDHTCSIIFITESWFQKLLLNFNDIKGLIYFNTGLRICVERT